MDEDRQNSPANAKFCWRSSIKVRIEYSSRLPVIVFSETGWEIERETYTEELFDKLEALTKSNDYSFVAELKDRNRGMILL